jgi:hypothetical protein
VILCADDYGLNEEVDRAILQLGSRGKISAASCMVSLERCGPEALGRLREHEARLDIGLHLCLTKEDVQAPEAKTAPSQKSPSCKALLAAALARKLDQGEMEAEIGAQYDLFVSKSGRAPNYLDGHLHAHQFPVVREALISCVLRLPPGKRPYVRNTSMSLLGLCRRGLPWAKAFFIARMGAIMRQALLRAGIRTNDGFAGIYNFKKHANYAKYLPKFIEMLAQPNAILVIHPGETGDWRQSESRALMQFDFRPGAINRFCSK